MRSYGTQYRVPELFHNPYPFEKFEMNQLLHLEKDSLNFTKNI